MAEVGGSSPPAPTIFPKGNIYMAEVLGFKEQIRKLVQLQELDSEIFDLTAKKETFPVRIKEMDDSLEAKKGGMEAADTEFKRLQVLKGEKETDMQAKEEKIAKHDSELYQIKNNKEYQALQQEINSIKADVSLLEEELINLFDEIEKARVKCEAEKKIFEKETQDVEKEKQAIKTEETELTARLGDITSKRSEFAEGVAHDVLDKYQKILAKRGRIAITPVKDEFCGACNMHLRPQIINDAKIQKNLVLCENCVRILYVED